MEFKGWISEFGILVLGVIMYIYVSFYMAATFRGFYCDDESIRYPFRGAAISYSTWVMLTYCPSILMIIITEFVIGLQNNDSKINFRGFLVPKWIVLTYSNCVDYVIGAIFVALLGNLIQNLAGRLRPVFIDICNPNIDLSNCDKYNHSYIIDYECQTQEHQDLLTEIRKSFPCGLAVNGFYVIVFCVYYTQVKWNVQKLESLRMWKHLVQAVFITLWVCVVLTRYVDNLHHLTDVMVGIVLGAAIGWFTIQSEAQTNIILVAVMYTKVPQNFTKTYNVIEMGMSLPYWRAKRKQT